MLADVLLEILAWLACFDWLGRPRTPRENEENTKRRTIMGNSLIRASQVCRYWRRVTLGNRALWGHISLEETIWRDYDSIDREFTCRVQRSVGLSTGIFFRYVECPEDENEIARRTSVQKALMALPADSPLRYSNLRDWVMTSYRLWPLALDCVRRSHTLVLKAKGETLSDLFGYQKLSWTHETSDYGGRVVLGPAQITMPKSSPWEPSRPDRITSLPRLEDLTLELTDRTYLFSFPSLPNLRHLTLTRTTIQPHVVLPLADHLLEPPRTGSTWYSNIERNQEPFPIFPSLESLTINMPHLNIYSLHQFLYAHAALLTSLELQTTADLLMLYDHPQCSIVLPRLKVLNLSQLTRLLSSHVEFWNCPSLEELHISLPSRLPILTKFDLTSYPSLKTFSFTYPTNESTGLSPDLEKDVEEQKTSTGLLISMLRALPELEHLIVNGWKFSGGKGEPDWVLALMPKRELSQKVAIPKPRPPPVKSRQSIMNMIISEDGLLLGPDGKPIAFSDSEEDSPTSSPKKGMRFTGVDGDGEYNDGNVWKALGVSVQNFHFPGGEYRRQSRPKTPEPVAPEGLPSEDWEMACPLLSSLRLINCTGVEKSALLELVASRMFPAALAPTTPIDPMFVKQTLEREHSSSPELGASQSSESSRALSSPPRSPVAIRSAPAHADIACPSPRLQNHALNDPSPLLVYFKDCSMTNEQFGDLCLKSSRNGTCSPTSPTTRHSKQGSKAHLPV
ncbi:hypothetical protein CPB86DRAFT_800579 [Serendipita vermifera]|nr:hypothetical protein CPB86DRAFT_800579 [Serendipita vermifera]